MKIITSGRTDLDDYFKNSGILSSSKLKHTPFLVFVATTDSVEVRIVDNVNNLLEYPDETQIMAQWAGKWRSDYFQFKVSDLRRYDAAHPH